MELNTLLFPAPSTNYSPEDIENDCMYIPRFFRYNKQARRAIERNLFKDKNKENTNLNTITRTMKINSKEGLMMNH
jgi:hypothetical protein